MNMTAADIMKQFNTPPPPVPWKKPCDVPKYREATLGDWRLVNGKMPPLIRGYYSGLGVPQHKVNPTLMHKGAVWMSITPMELESQAPHVHFAKGHTVICGLGMGMVLYNILRKPEVTKVTVIEKDKAVIAMFPMIADVCKWKGIEKLTIVNADATKHKMDEPVDFLCSDIAGTIGAAENFKQLKKMNKNIKPRLIAQWCGEFDYLDYLRGQGIPAQLANDILYGMYAEKSGMPLIRWKGISDYCVHVVEQCVLY